MLITYSPPEGATIYDLVLNIYTTLNLMTKFIQDNNIQHIDLITSVGQSFIYDSDYIFDEFIFDEIIENNYIFCTGKGIPQTDDNYLLTEEPQILADEGNDLFVY